MGDSLMYPVQPHVGERGVVAMSVTWPKLVSVAHCAEAPRLCPEVELPMVGLTLAFKMEVQSVTPSPWSKQRRLLPR